MRIDKRCSHLNTFFNVSYISSVNDIVMTHYYWVIIWDLKPFFVEILIYALCVFYCLDAIYEFQFGLLLYIWNECYNSASLRYISKNFVIFWNCVCIVTVISIRLMIFEFCLMSDVSINSIQYKTILFPSKLL